MPTIIIKHFKTPYGELVIGSFDEELVLCDWRYRKMRKAIDERILTALKSEFVEGTSQIIQNTIVQLEEYIRNERTQFDIPLKLIGTDFQKDVWAELLKIPFGKTETYLGLSKKLDNEKAIRAVASANGANAISILVPCHRVIGSKGELTGYAGGLEVKKKLLRLEGSHSVDEQLNLF